MRTQDFGSLIRRRLKRAQARATVGQSERRAWLWAWVLVCCLCSAPLTQAEPLPTPLNGALLLKLIDYEDSLKQKNEIRILVVNDLALANHLAQKIGTALGGRLAAVYRDTLPQGTAADVIYLNSERQLAELRVYAKKRGALTVGHELALAHKGVALILFDDGGLPGITISVAPSKELGLRWDPKVLEVSQLIY